MFIRRRRSSRHAVGTIAAATVYVIGAMVSGGAISAQATGDPVSDIEIHDMHFVDQSTGWLVGRTPTHYSSAPMIKKTTDGGMTWAAESVPNAAALLKAGSFPDVRHGWAIGQSRFFGTGENDAIVVATTDGGSTWLQQPIPSPAGKTAEAVSFADATHGAVVGEDQSASASGFVYVTSDGGRTWNSPTIPAADQIIGVDFVDALHVWVLGSEYNATLQQNQTIVMASSDGGVSWGTESTPAPTSGYFSGLTFADGRTGWIVGSDGTSRDGLVMSTVDGGNTWALADLGSTPMSLSGVDFTDRQNGWVVGRYYYSSDPNQSEAVVGHSTDGGQSWSFSVPAGSGPYDSPIAVSFANRSYGWLADALDGGTSILQTVDAGANWDGWAANTVPLSVGPPCAPTAAPVAPPQHVSVTARNGSATLSWDPVSGADPLCPTRYTVTAYADSSANGIPQQTLNVAGNAAGATMVGLPTSCLARYRFSVVASNSLGSSPPSDPTPMVITAGHPDSVPGSSDPAVVVIMAQGLKSSTPQDANPYDPRLYSYCSLREAYDGQLPADYEIPKSVAQLGVSFDPVWTQYSQSMPPADPNLTDRLALGGALVLPYSYAGSFVVGDKVYQNPHNDQAPGSSPREFEAALMKVEVEDVHRQWPAAKIVIIGHSNGGLTAETYWEQSESSARANNVTRIFAVQSPINGVNDPGVLSRLSFLGAGADRSAGINWMKVDEYAHLWSSKASRDASLLSQEANDQNYFVPIGAPGDELFAVFNSLEGGDQLIAAGDTRGTSAESQLLYRDFPRDHDPAAQGPDYYVTGNPPWRGILAGVPPSHQWSFTQPAVLDQFLTAVNLAKPQSAARVGSPRVAPPTPPAAPTGSGPVSNVSPMAGSVGDPVTISGSGFGSTAGTVTFTSDASAIPAVVATWTDSQIVARIPAGAQTGPLGVVTNSGTQLVPGTMTVLDVPNGVATLSAQQSAALDGQSSTITVRALGSNRLPVANAVVKISDGVGTYTPTVTNAAGLAVLSLPGYGTEGMVVYSGAAYTAQNFSWQAPPSMSLTMTAPATAVAGASSTVSATLMTSTGAPIPGQTVGFNVSGSSSASLSSTQATTDASGVASVTVSSPTAGEAAVAAVANDNAARGSTLVSWIPSVTSISPVNGSSLGGTTVTIRGNGFSPASGVSFGGTDAGAVTVVDAHTILAKAPPSPSTGPVDVQVAGAGGLSAPTSADLFTYQLTPTVSRLSPNGGSTAGGGTVAISGINFHAGATVTFGGVPASMVTVNSPTSILAVAPPRPQTGVVDVVVATPDGGSSPTTNADAFAYDAVPTVNSLTAHGGPTPGGTSVTITGTNFAPGVRVRFGQSRATAVTLNSSTSITAVAPAAVAGTVDVIVTTPGGSSPTNSSDAFTYELPPTLSAVSPQAGPTAGGTQVTVTGSNFGPDTAVTFGGIPAASVTIQSTTTLLAVSPAHSSGTVDVVVNTFGGSPASTPADYFAFGPPQVSGVAPSAGSLSGGLLITVTGMGFIPGVSATVGGLAASNVNVTSPTTLTADTPAATTLGVVDVQITNPNGQSSLSGADAFTYDPVPTVTGISPASGPYGGGTPVQITGAGFTPDATVVFGSYPATSVVYNSATSVTATSPYMAPGSTFHVQVTTPGGTSPAGSDDQFTTPAQPQVTGLSPDGGQLSGGGTITITGTAFPADATVTFGSTPAATVVVNSSTSITASIPASPARQSVDVTINSPSSGQSGSSYSDEFAYGVPAVTSLSRSGGSTAGGDFVYVYGTNFAQDATVTFGGTRATQVYHYYDGALGVVTPGGVAATVDVVVTNPGGPSPSGPADQFTFEPVPAVSAVAPTAGPTAGGTVVNISGNGFTSDAQVYFGYYQATAVVVNSPTSITATSPPQYSQGMIDVSVSNIAGSSAVNPGDQFTYDDAPVVSGVSPAAGPVAGGNQVTVSGTGFTLDSKVTFGGVAATSVVVNSTSSVTAVVPASSGLTSTAVDVVVTTPGGSSTTGAADQYTYDPLPVVLAVNPPVGAATGGTVVTITGSGFTSNSLVMFGSQMAAAVTVISPTQIQATSPVNLAASIVDVEVATPGGVSLPVPTDKFVYSPVPLPAN